MFFFIRHNINETFFIDKGSVKMEKEILNQIKNYDENTYEHCKRTAELVKILAVCLNFDEKMMHTAAMLHDVGKMFIPKNILNKNGLLTAEERSIIDTHSLLGYQYLKKMGIENNICILVLFHHGKEKVPEKYHCMEKKLEKEIQLLRSVDIFDALSSNRPYRKAMDKNEIQHIMLKENCLYLDKIFSI